MSSESIAEAFDRARCTGHLHAIRLDGRDEVGSGADDPVNPASVIKVLLALACGELDGSQRLRLGDAERTPGPVGLSLFRDEAELSVRDAVTLMLTISDNVVTDALYRLVGPQRLRGLADALGLRATRMECSLGDLIARHDVSADGPLSTTGRDQTTLLRAVWAEPAAAPVRWAMQRQLTRDRLAAGFGGRAEVAAKSGGLFGVWRNEVGVVTLADGSAYAVAVFARALEPPLDPWAANAAISQAAVTAVDSLR
ncbi:serine hydrolase [Nocardioides nanhaiensis]|uniref:Serine hydrolase n=1 Tax=Nocardioides nanhaiensis TaxID=1476871 RepID=A0ABP8WA72_9ACTN